MITITFPDGKTKEYKKGVTGKEVAESIGKRLAADAVAMLVDNTPRDLSFALDHNALVKFLTFADEQGREIFRHSSSHLLAHAISRLYPEAKPTIGPPVEEGFYYDFDDLRISDADLPRVEEEMRKIVAEDHIVERIEYKTQAEAVAAFKDNPYKVEMIKGHEEGSSAYKEGDFLDLCRGPHVPRTGMIKVVKLMKLAGAYWRGDAKNKQLTRIYGITFPEEKQLKEYLAMLEEAEKRDHRKIGAQLDLFAISEDIGPGLVLWLPKGNIVKELLEDWAKETEAAWGYQRVTTPLITKEGLFKTSEHLPHYSDSMFPPMSFDSENYYIKPMNCPFHHQVFKARTRSYRELPLRLAEYGWCHRFEQSGTLFGLMRVRGMQMNDAHIYCAKEQAVEEFYDVIRLHEYYYKALGIKNYHMLLCLRDPKGDKYHGDKAMWDEAESLMRKAMEKSKVPYKVEIGGAAFYGPKIDFQIFSAIGREFTASTNQIDLFMPVKFDLKFTGQDGREHVPVCIHRAPLGTHERFIGFLIEHFGGRFPLWLSPVQVKIMTITDSQKDFAHALAEELKSHSIRVEVDDRSESMPKKVHDSQIMKIPLMLTIGDKELANHTVAIRTLDGKVKFGVRKEEFVKAVITCVAERSLFLPW